MIDFSHFSQLPSGNNNSSLVARETALNEAITLVINEVQKYGFTYSDFIGAVGYYAHIQGLKTVELWLEAAYSESLDYGVYRQTEAARNEVFAKIYGAQVLMSNFNQKE